MSVQDDLTAVQRSIDDLCRSVGRLEQHVGSGLEIRRVRTDADHLRESVALLREAAPGLSPALSAALEQGEPPSPRKPDLVAIPDTPYDSSLWTDSDDEGLGARDRHAP